MVSASIYAEIWAKRVLALVCIIAYCLFYFVLSCGKRLQRKTYWLQCQMAICAIIRCLVTLVASYYAMEYFAIPLEPLLKINKTTHLDFLRSNNTLNMLSEYAGILGVFQDIGDLCLLTWNAFTLMTLYQYYYDLKRPFAIEPFTLLNALFTMLIWFLTIAFSAVFFIIHEYDIGYKIFWNLQLISIIILTGLHLLAILILIGLTWRLQSKGLIIDLLPCDQADNWKTRYVLDEAWRRRRRRHFVLIYILALAMLGSDTLVGTHYLYTFLRGIRLDDVINFWLKRLAQFSWYIVAIVWPCLWMMYDGILKKQIKSVCCSSKKASVTKERFHEKIIGSDDKLKKKEIVVSAIMHF